MNVSELETNVALISSARHKGEYWEKNVPIINPLVKPYVVPVPRGCPEPDVLEPDGCAQGKLSNFASRPGVLDGLEKVHADKAGVADVLCMADRVLLTTDRDGIGAMLTIATLAQSLRSATEGKRPVTIHAYNTAGFATMPVLRESRGRPKPKDIITAWEKLCLTLSPGFIHLLSDKKELKTLHQHGYIADEILNPRSIGGIDWVQFVLAIPAICALKKNDDLWMEAQTNNKFFHVDSKFDDVNGVQTLLNEFLRGLPHSVMREVLMN